MDKAEVKNKFDFLDCLQGTELFAKLDFALKDGVHIQERGKQKELFLYIQSFPSSLKHYYFDFFGLGLEEGGSDSEKYYYLKFYPDIKGGIPLNHKHVISLENIIIGLLLYKVYYIDRHIELNSLSKFQRLIRLDYPDLKPSIVRLLAKVRREKSTQLNDDRIDTCIKSAFDEFNKMKWIEMESDGTFEILPSFQRLTKEFSDEINNMDEILKEG